MMDVSASLEHRLGPGHAFETDPIDRKDPGSKTEERADQPR
jgi:hypothetical protein